MLPVEPPEVDTLLLQRMEDQVEVIGRPELVRGVEGHILLRGRVNAHGAGHCGIRLLPRLDARSRMQIQRRLQSLCMKIGKEVVWIGEKRLVPGIAAPAKTVPRLV